MTPTPTLHNRAARLNGLATLSSLGMALSLTLCVVLSACNLPPKRSACPSGQDLTPEMLHGQWTAQIAGEAPWTLTLGPHPEHAGSLRGELAQGQQRRAVVADLDDGEFTLEETHDGQRIAATWLGSLPASSCGHQIQGQRALSGQDSRNFLISRTP